MIDADLKRLEFVFNHGVFTNKDSLYLNALEKVEAAFPRNAAVAQAGYLRANMYARAAESATPDTLGKIKAKALAEKMIRLYPKSEGAINSQNLISEIIQPQLALETEKVNLPGKAFRNLVSYRNIEQLFFRIIPVQRNFLNEFWGKEENEIWAGILKHKAIKSFSINLPSETDYRTHSVEVKIDALTPGTYIIASSIDENFSMARNLMSRQVIHISNLALIGRPGHEYFVLHRESGEPLKGAEVQAWQKNYDYATRKFNYAAREKYTADEHGSFTIKKMKEYRELNFELIYKGEKLFLEDEYGTGYYNDFEEKTRNQIFLFTDRSLYRPGQQVYFKGLMMSRNGKTKLSSLLTGEKINIGLYDPNGTRISERQMQTNAYGSFHGNFQLPEGLLNGNFTIRDSAGTVYHSISVEEYKRPKFLTELNKPTGTYRLNDTITISGNAKAYAGNALEGAQVTYRVTRKARFPIWWNWGYRIFPPQNENAMEITYGTTVTDQNGNFTISFTAIPDEKIQKKDQPIFHYEIIADVTDINGETRTGRTTVEVGYQALHLSWNSGEKIHTDSLANTGISSTNTAGDFERATVKLEVFSLQDPGKIFRSRYWEAPDRHLYSKEEFYKMFPHDPYADENIPQRWAVKELVYSKADTTTETGKWNWDGKKLKGGWYKVVGSSMDKYGEPVKVENFIFVIDESQPTTEPIYVFANKRIAEPGDEIIYKIRTGFGHIYLVEFLERMDGNNGLRSLELNREKPVSATVKVSETDRGGIALNYAFVKNNRAYNGVESFMIPWSNKELQISFSTFRDKILPGSEEKWTVNIKGKKGEKVAAEALLNMYDASLDQFKKHQWTDLRSIWPTIQNNVAWHKHGFTGEDADILHRYEGKYVNVPEKSYDDWLHNDWLSFGGRYHYLEGRASGVVVSAAVPQKSRQANDANLETAESSKVAKDMMTPPAVEEDGNADNTPPPGETEARKNFRETAFFFPALTTDKDGNISFSFTAPEALTKWKVMAMAHSAQLQTGYNESFTVTQKPLMVQPNAPRFFREGDNLDLSVKVVNMGEVPMKGAAMLQLTDALSGKPVDGWFKNVFPTQHFSIEPGSSQAVRFPFSIPVNFNSSLVYTVKATTTDGSFSDGEESAAPVLTNRMLVTETLPLNMRKEEKKNFTFEKLLQSANSGSLTHHALTVEYTSNPAWYAVQALPYLMEYPYDCSEQTFNRYYANALASFILQQAPRIKEVFEKWKITDTAALMSNLQKNAELKSVMLQETPWVLQAENEQKQKASIAMLFDLVKLAGEQEKALSQLNALQTTNGGFSWFKGGRDDRFITQYIITGIGRLKHLGVLENAGSQLNDLVNKAMPYLDARITEEYDALIKSKADLKKDQLSHFAIQYLYMRSFFVSNRMSPKVARVHDYYKQQASQFWLKQNKYMQAMIAVVLHRTGNSSQADAVLASLRQNAINHAELGTYWKEVAAGGYYWHQAPIESQAMIISAFSEIKKSDPLIDDMKTWLLKNKQTNNWRTTKATADACYALLLQGSQWLDEEKEVVIKLGNTIISSKDQAVEEGTGYFKHSIAGDKVQQGMGNIVVEVNKTAGDNKSTSSSWGSVYWQYFEDLDKITPAASPLTIVRKLFIQRNSDRGPVLEAVKENDEIKVGDKLIVRIEIKTDRNMEYIHLKDMRASGTEPVNVLSGFKFQGGLGYYESTKDASTNFFISWLPRGSYVFEYPMFASNEGNFSTGVASIQCMYAPEFSSHSEGLRINISGK